MSEYIAELKLMGPLSFCLNSGVSIKPRSAKAQGLLALLATSPEMSRPRRWIEDKLWSDRGPEQASASLRQTLSEIRRVIPKELKLLEANRSAISLNADKISICLTNNGDALCNEQDFLEGIDIRDQEFEEWLRNMRSTLRASLGNGNNPAKVIEPTHTHQDKLVIGCKGFCPEQERGGVLADMLANQIGKNITEQISAWCKSESAEEACDADVADTDIDVECKVVSDDESNLALVRIASRDSGQILFSRTFQSHDLSNAMLKDDKLAKITFDAAENVSVKLPNALGEGNSIAQASGYAQIALSKIFQFEQQGLEEADHLLDQAFHLDPNGSFLAWKALIRTIQSIELFDPDIDQLRMQADILLNQALSNGTDNAITLSIAALVRSMLFDDEECGLDLAMLAFDNNPRSAFALQAISVTQMFSGDLKSAYKSSKSGHTIASSSRYRHWWDLYHGLICIASNRFDEALVQAQAAHRRAPTFRPPLRNLIALHTHFGNCDEALKCRETLLALEPDFSIERFVEDEHYPNRTLKRAGLLSADFSSLKQQGSTSLVFG